MNEAGYVVCATCGDYAVDFNAVMLDCSTCENSYHHTCVGMGLGELGRRTAATRAMRKKGKKGGADGDVTGTLYDWKCPDCQHQPRPRQPEPDKDKEEVLVIEDTDDEEDDDGERTTYIDLSYNVDIHRVAPSQRALLPTTTTARRPAVHMQNVAGLLNRANVGASTSRASNSNSNSNIGASTSTSKPVPASTSTSPQSHNATTTTTATRNVQTPLSPPPSRSPSRTGPTTNGTVPFVDFTAMATSSKKRRRSPESGEGEDERAKKKSRVAGPAALLRTPVEPIDLTLSDDEVLVTPAAPSTSSRRDAASVSSSRRGPGSVSSGTTDIATEDEPVPTRNLMRASLAGRTPRVPLASPSGPRPPATVPSKRRLSASPSNSQPSSVKRAVVQNQEQEDEDDEEHAFFRSRRPSGVGSGGGLTRTRSDAAVLALPASASTATPRSAAPTRTQSDGALALGPSSQPSGSRAAIEPGKTNSGKAGEPPSRRPTPPDAPRSAAPTRIRPDSALPPTEGMDNRKTTIALEDETEALSKRPTLASTSTFPAPISTSTRTPPSSSRPLGSSSASGQRAVQAVDDRPKETSVAVHDADVDDLPDYVSDEERERESASTALPAASTAPRASSASRASASSSTARPIPTAAPATTTSTSTATTTFRRPALPPPRAAAPVPSTTHIPSNPAPPTTTSRSQPQPLFLPDSPSPSPERRERERLMSLPPISFLDEDDAETGTGDVDMDMDELEGEEDELESAGGVAVVKKKPKQLDREELGRARAEAEPSPAVKEKARLEDVHARPAPTTNNAVVKKKLFDRTAAGSDVPTERRKEKKSQQRVEQEEQDAGRSYPQQVVDGRLENVSEAGLASFPDRTRAGEGEASVKVKKKKHRDRDRDAVDPFARPALGLSASLEKPKHADAGEGESSTSGSMKDKKKHRDRDWDAVDPLARPAPGLSASASREKTKRAVLASVDGREGDSSTSGSVKNKKHRDRDAGVVDPPAVPSTKFREPATPERRVDDLTVSWGRLQELTSFSPSSATKKTAVQMDVDGDGDSFPSTVREEVSGSRQLGRKTARPPLLDDSSSTRRPPAATSAERVPVTRFPAAAAAGPSSSAPASSSSSTARPPTSASRPDAEQRKENKAMQMQRARKTVLRREGRDDAPAQTKARDPAPSSSAVPEHTKAAALDRADAPGKGKSTLDKYSARAVASSSSTVLPPSTSTSALPPSSRPSAAVLDPSSSRPSAPSTAPSSSRSKHKHRERFPVADPSLPFEAPVVPRRKAIAGVDYPLPDLPISPTKEKANKKATARKAPRNAEEDLDATSMDVDVDARVHTSRKGKEKEQAINVDDDSPPHPKEKARPESRPKPPPIPRLRSASIWSSSTPTPAPSPYTTSSPSLDAVTAFLKKRRMANPLPSSSTVPSVPTQGQKMAATKRRLERGEHESDLPVPMTVLANAREMQTLRRLVKRSVVVEKPEYRVGEVKSDVVTAFDWAKYRAEKERDEQGVGDFATA